MTWRPGSCCEATRLEGEMGTTRKGSIPDRALARAYQRVMRFAQANFPGKTGVLDGGQRRRAGSAVVAADGDDVRARFGHARGNDADAGAGNEFYADARARIHGAQVVDQLREVF